VKARVERFTHPRCSGVFLRSLHWGEAKHPPVVLLHGGGANAHWWDHIAGALCRRRYVVALDFRGHGDSDYPEGLEVGAFNADLEALCAHLDIASLDLISQGRAVLGLGTSGRVVIEDWHGVSYRQPLRRTREYLEIIRLALSGNPISSTTFLGRL